MIGIELRKHLVSSAAEQRIVEVTIGSRYVAVMLEDGNVGIATLLRPVTSSESSLLADARALVGRTTTEILPYMESDDEVTRVLGLAVANAIANRRGAGQHEADLLHVISVGFLDRVGMIGDFGDLVEPLKRRVREVLTVNHDPGPSGHSNPLERALAELPRCDVAVIASDALVTRDLDALLEAAAGCREVALVGISTPLVPDVFRPFGVTLLSGATVTDGPGVLQAVTDGDGIDTFAGRTRVVNVRP
jgi:uncharacterized protein (DUF4213/DUF364 family)